MASKIKVTDANAPGLALPTPAPPLSSEGGAGGPATGPPPVERLSVWTGSRVSSAITRGSTLVILCDGSHAYGRTPLHSEAEASLGAEVG
jgi:hypothetical protein